MRPLIPGCSILALVFFGACGADTREESSTGAGGGSSSGGDQGSGGGSADSGGSAGGPVCPQVASSCPEGCGRTIEGFAIDPERMCVDETQRLTLACANDELGACKSTFYCFERLDDGVLFYADACLDEPELSSAWKQCSEEVEEALLWGGRDCEGQGGAGGSD